MADYRATPTLKFSSGSTKQPNFLALSCLLYAPKRLNWSPDILNCKNRLRYGQRFLFLTIDCVQWNSIRNFNKSLIKWLTRDGKQPVDDPDPTATVCVLDGLAQLLNVECEAAIVVANILGFGVFAGCLVIFFFVFKRRYERKVEQTEERMRALGLLLSGTLLTLDEWEIPRERIVINRFNRIAYRWPWPSKHSKSAVR